MLESSEEQKRRFECECEFVQALANPNYLNFLSQRGFFKEEYFINYLKYLLYWKRPEYAKCLKYPQCLFMLEALQEAEFRKALESCANAKYIEDQLIFQWLYYLRKRQRLDELPVEEEHEDDEEAEERPPVDDQIMVTNSLLVFIAGVLSVQLVSGEGDSGQCSLNRLDRFNAYLYDRCPYTTDDECFDDSLDNRLELRYRCFEYVDINSTFDEEMLLLNSSEMIKLLRSRELYRRSTCLVALFYSPGCPFSASLAPYFNALPSLYPRVTAVAIDATEFSKFNSRYGISGTPTVILWVKGIAVARMEEKTHVDRGLSAFVRYWTDLEPRDTYEPIYTGPLVIEVDRNANFPYLLGAWAVIIAGSTYYFLNSRRGQELKDFILRMLERPDDAA
ncbi:unnamed protein product, partial [Mesorhabditis spiculigera]